MSAAAPLLILPFLLLQEPPPAPVPDAAAQKQAEKLVRDVFKADYARTSAADRLAFVKKLIAQAEETKDDSAARFVLLREARDVAAAAGDADLSYRAILMMSVRFTISSLPMKNAALAAVGKTARTPEEIRALAGYYLKLVEESLDGDDYDIASQAAASAIVFAKSSKDLPLVSRASAKVREVSDLRERYAKVKAAQPRLAAAPEDAPANGVIGLYKCIVKSDWEAGLPLLVKSDDATLAALAAKETAQPVLPAEQVALGDEWWDRAENEAGRVRENLRCRAGVWYERAYGRLAGLTRAKAEKRISELFPGRPPGDWMDVTDPRLFGFEGRFGEEFQLICQPEMAVIPKMKQFPEGEYDGISVRVRFGPNRKAWGGMTFENNSRYLFVNGEQDSVQMTHLEAGGWVDDPSAPCRRVDEYFLSVVIVKGDYVVTVDGQEKFKVKAPVATIRHLGVYGAKGTVQVDRIHLRRKE